MVQEQYNTAETGEQLRENQWVPNELMVFWRINLKKPARKLEMHKREK